MAGLPKWSCERELNNLFPYYIAVKLEGIVKNNNIKFIQIDQLSNNKLRNSLPGSFSVGVFLKGNLLNLVKNSGYLNEKQFSSF